MSPSYHPSFYNWASERQALAILTTLLTTPTGRLRGAPGSTYCGSTCCGSTYLLYCRHSQDDFEKHLAEVGTSFAELATYLGDEDVKEPTELFATLQKFLMRFEAIYREVRGCSGGGVRVCEGV